MNHYTTTHDQEEGRTFFVVLNVLMGMAVAMAGVSMAVLVLAALSR